MLGWAGLPAFLREKPGVFGEFNQCLVFQSVNQNMASNPCSLTSTLPTPMDSKVLSTEHDVSIYLDELQNTRPDVCILAFTKLERESNGELPLPISRRIFEHVVQAFDISPIFLTILNTGLATYTSTFLARDKENDEEQGNAQFIIQQNRAYSAFSMATSYSFKTGKTRVLIFGVEPSSLSELFAYLHSISSLAYGPMMIPAVAMELQAQAISMTIKDCHDRIHSIEIATGMRQFNHPHEKKGMNTQDWRNLDLISITRDLSSFLSRFAFLKMQAETGEYLVRQMERSTELFIERIGKGQNEFGIENQHEIMLKLQHLQSWYLGIAARCRYLSERTVAQSQTVYCLIASQDNSTNIEIARASRNIAEDSHRENEAMRVIAELSRQDNESMIQIAKNSRTVAVATAQDSAAMQVIAAVTILFLPATFTATFFSMAFFDFSDADKPHISPLSWIYVLVTAILTGVIQLAWATISKRKRAKIAETPEMELRLH